MLLINPRTELISNCKTKPQNATDHEPCLNIVLYKFILWGGRIRKKTFRGMVNCLEINNMRTKNTY